MLKIANRIVSATGSCRQLPSVALVRPSGASFWQKTSCFGFGTPKYILSPYDAEDTRVLIADSFSKQGLAELENSGIEVTYDAELQGESLAEALAEVKPDVLVVRSTPVNQEIIDANDNLQLVLRAGAGYDTIDHDHCSRRGIYVANCPAVNANAVAELTMGLILSIDRRIAESTYQLKTGNWNKALFRQAMGVKGRTLGLIGGGNVA